MLLLLGGGYDDGVLEDVLGPAQPLVGDEGAVGARGEVGGCLCVGLDPFLLSATFNLRSNLRSAPRTWSQDTELDTERAMAHLACVPCLVGVFRGPAHAYLRSDHRLDFYNPKQELNVNSAIFVALKKKSVFSGGRFFSLLLVLMI